MSTAGNPSEPVPIRSVWPADCQAPPALGLEEQAALHHAMSHDLRAPLRVVEGFTRILKEDYGPQLDAQANQHLDRVLSAAERMDAMLNALLAQAQLGSEPLQRQAVDVSALAREVGREQLGVLNGAARAELVVADGLVAQADPTLLRRVLENLIGNALKYSDKVDRPLVSVGAIPESDPEVYLVRDNGVGFDMAHADKLFGMFQRLHSARDFPGNGVGLAAAQGIVRRHGGRIWAESAVGQGACFYFTLDASRHHQRRTER